MYALKLWAIHGTNVEPLCKIPHPPTAARMIEAIKSAYYFLYIHHVAVFSLHDKGTQLGDLDGTELSFD